MPTTFYTGKDARLSIEDGVGIIRFLRNDNPEDRSFDAICVFTPLSDNVVKISGMLGKVTRAHLRLLFEVLLDKGWSVVYARRRQGRRLPMGKLMEDGDFAGWWRVDLKSIQKKEQDNESRN